MILLLVDLLLVRLLDFVLLVVCTSARGIFFCSGRVFHGLQKNGGLKASSHNLKSVTQFPQ